MCREPSKEGVVVEREGLCRVGSQGRRHRGVVRLGLNTSLSFQDGTVQSLFT